MGSSGQVGLGSMRGIDPGEGQNNAEKSTKWPRGLHLKKLGNGEGEMSLERRDERTV